MSSPLNKTQKAYLAQLANRAFNLEAAKARGRSEAWTETVEDWRHGEVVKACGKLGLRCCTQRDYKFVEGHFYRLLGQEDKAFECFMAAQNEGGRQIEHKITAALRTLGKKIDYAEAICNRMHHVGLTEASEQQLNKVFIALRYQVNRTKAQFSNN